MLGRNFFTVGVGAGLSRLLGFARDMMIAATLGAGASADAFVVAFRLPNLFRRLLSEGALNPAFIPIYERLQKERGVDAADGFAADALATLALLLAAVTAVAEVGMGVVVFALAPGFADDAGKFAMTTYLARLAFPFLLFASLAAMCAAALNARRKFVAAAFAPAALNVVLIASLAAAALSGRVGGAAATWLACAVSLGGAVQLAICVAAARRAGFHMRWRAPDLSSPHLRRLFALALPGAFAGGVAQVNAFVGSVVGSASPSAVSYLYFADRVYQLPLGIVGVAIGLVLLPELTQRLADHDEPGARRAQARAIHIGWALTAPACVALVLLSGPIIDVLFRRGAFDATASVETSRALAAFALGMPAYVLAKALQAPFFARGDIRTPVLVALAGAAIDIVLSVALFQRFEHVGVAVAAAVAGWANVVGLAALMRRRGLFLVDRETSVLLARTVVASLAMGIVVSAASWALAQWGAPGGALARAAALAATCGAGLAAYALIGQFIGAFDIGAMRRAIAG